MQPCRLIVDPPQPGARNMAVDEALLDAAAAGAGATLRLYRWSSPTLSLGYFQPLAARAAHPASAGCPCVRRHSGGGAIVHDHELTYSLAVPVGGLPGGGPPALYRLVHSVLIRVLSQLMPAAAGRLALCDPQEPKPAADEPFLCFQRRSQGDVIVRRPGGDDKVIGSAQRKRAGAVLQHGSILLRQSRAAPELPGLAELLQTAPPPADGLSRAIAERVSRELQMSLVEQSLTAAESAAADAIAEQKFAADGWTRRR